MLIAQISDTHLAVPAEGEGDRLRDLEQCVDHINRLDPRPDLVIHTGDVTHWARVEEYRQADAILDGLPCPVYVVPGNRDRRDAMAEVFGGGRCRRNEGGHIQYAVEGFDLRIVLVDTLNEERGLGRLCDRRLQHLAGLLEADRRATLIFMHHPPFDVMAAPDPLQFECRDQIAALGRILARNGHVVGVNCGHVHRPASGAIGTIPAQCMPSVAVDLRKGSYPEPLRHVPVYQLHRYCAQTGMSTKLLPATDGDGANPV